MKARPRESIDVIRVGRDSAVMNTEGWGSEIFLIQGSPCWQATELAECAAPQKNLVQRILFFKSVS